VLQVNSKGYKVCGEASSVCGTITINKRKVPCCPGTSGAASETAVLLYLANIKCLKRVLFKSYCTIVSDILLFHSVWTNVLIVSRFGQKCQSVTFSFLFKIYI